MASDFGNRRPVNVSLAARWGQQGLFVLLFQNDRHGIGRQVLGRADHHVDPEADHATDQNVAGHGGRAGAGGLLGDGDLGLDF